MNQRVEVGADPGACFAPWSLVTNLSHDLLFVTVDPPVRP